ncbi:DUF4105 domain-containing protein [soil metagenome]
MIRTFGHYLFLLLLPLILVTRQASAQPELSPVEGDGTELTVYVMTMGPGSLVWERFGHNAIWIQDTLRGTDKAYNYGLFDFEQENFILRFVQGRMLYWMEGFDAYLTAEMYQRDDRSVWIQELNLSPAERVRLRDFLEWNEREENKFYRYDYYRDNCSTRVRDAIDLILGGRIHDATSAVPSGSTYRSHTRRLTTNDIPIYTGLMMGLGSPVDRPISIWEEMFLPLKLREHLRGMATLDEQGREVPLVRAEMTMYQSTRPPVREMPPMWWPGYLLAGLVIGGALVGLAWFGRRSRAARYGFVLVASVWSLLSGLGAMVLLGLWALTDHGAAYANENLLQLNPLSLALLLLIPALAYGVQRGRNLTLYIALFIAGASLLGLVLKVLPWFVQVNAEVVALALPVHLAIAYATYLLVGMRGTRPSVSTSPPQSARIRAGR